MTATQSQLDESSAAGRKRLPVVPASAFGIVLGIAGLSNAWRAAAGHFALPATVGDGIALLALAVWFVLVCLYGLKWILFAEEARKEIVHPVQCCFIGLIGVATMLCAAMVAPFSGALALAFYWIGLLWTLVFAIWRTGALWQGGRDPTTTTPVLYLPTVAGCYVAAIVGAALRYSDLAQLAFGAGFFSWLAMESVILNRLLNAAELAEPLRPTIGIQFAPPAVGAAAYLSVTNGAPDLLAHAMVGYAMLQLLLALRLLPWVMKQPFAASYWAFSFGLTALATDLIRMVARGEQGILSTLAMPLLWLVTAAIALLAAGTIVLLFRGKLFPLARAL